jgi:hypothetical protein
MSENKEDTNDIRIVYYQEVFIISILPIVHVTGVIANIMCAKIFASLDNFKTSTYKLLTANSIISAIYLFLFTFAPLTQCFDLCEPWLSFFFITLYKKYISIFLCRSLDMTSNFINITIVVDRYLCMRNIRLRKQNHVIASTVVVYLIISSIIFIPNIFFHDIQKEFINKTNQTVKIVYELVESNFSRNTIAKSIILGTQFTISILSIIAVIVGNILLIVKLYDQLRGMNREMTKFVMVKVSTGFRSSKSTKNTKNTKVSSKENIRRCIDDRIIPEVKLRCVKKHTVSIIEKQTTILVVTISVIFIINQISQQCFNTLFLLIDTKSKHIVSYNFYIIAYNIFAYIFHSSNIFIYYLFNNHFSSGCKKLFNKH